MPQRLVSGIAKRHCSALIVVQSRKLDLPTLHWPNIKRDLTNGYDDFTKICRLCLQAFITSPCNCARQGSHWRGVSAY